MEVLALRLAQKLGDASAVSDYVALLAEYSESQLLTAYHRTISSGSKTAQAARFHVELARTHTGTTHNGKDYRLLALRVERRAVAAAVFDGDQLEFTQVRQLASAKDRALVSAEAFIARLAAHLPVDSAALEEMDIAQEIHRRNVHDTVVRALHDQTLPIWTVPKPDLLGAFGQPPLRSRKELRQVITDIWPVLDGSGAQTFIQDAVALGLHVQTERQFIH
jgi:hypothetical protein